jgi:hypothetical protein
MRACVDEEFVFPWGCHSPRGWAGRGGPSEAMLQLARRPAIVGFGSCTARRAASGSRNVTCARTRRDTHGHLRNTHTGRKRRG